MRTVADSHVLYCVTDALQRIRRESPVLRGLAFEVDVEQASGRAERPPLWRVIVTALEEPERSTVVELVRASDLVATNWVERMRDMLLLVMTYVPQRERSRDGADQHQESNSYGEVAAGPIG